MSGSRASSSITSGCPSTQRPATKIVAGMRSRLSSSKIGRSKPYVLVRVAHASKVMAMAGSVVSTLRRGRSDSPGAFGARPSGTGAPGIAAGPAPAAGPTPTFLTGEYPANAPVACSDAATAQATTRAISDQVQQHDDRV